MKVAYVSHVDSKWIKQRPHFIAESLARLEISVTYVCSILVRRKLLVGTQRLSVPVFRLPLLPQRWRALPILVDRVFSLVAGLMLVVLLRPDVVIVTHSRHRRLAVVLSKLRVRMFYDCMDLNNHFETALDVDAAEERKLVDLMEAVFCSSQPIAEHIYALSPEKSVHIVPNALDPQVFRPYVENRPAVVEYTVGYVGTISTWFDFESLRTLVQQHELVRVHLWGPSEVDIPEHSRIIYHGISPHGAAIEAMHQCSVLVLPFLVTDLIRAVDPVKVYEYIATGRPVITCSYPALDHFGGSIMRYNSTEEFVELVGTALNHDGLEPAEVQRFVGKNSWTARAASMIAVLETK